MTTATAIVIAKYNTCRDWAIVLVKFSSGHFAAGRLDRQARKWVIITPATLDKAEARAHANREWVSERQSTLRLEAQARENVRRCLAQLKAEETATA